MLTSVLNDLSFSLDIDVKVGLPAELPIDQRLKIAELYLQLSIAKSLNSLDQKGIYVHKR